MGIATAIAALGTIFAGQLGHAPASTLGARYAPTMNELLLIAAMTALAAGALSLLLILGVAEEALQEAFMVAVRQWPRDGLPNNPAGWLPGSPTKCPRPTASPSGSTVCWRCSI